MVRSCLISVTTCLLSIPLVAQEPVRPAVTGRWDLTIVTNAGRRAPSWLEVQWSGNRVLVGQFVGVVGSVRPISRLDFANDTLRFSVPPQWEEGNGAFQFTGGFATFDRSADRERAVTLLGVPHTGDRRSGNSQKARYQQQ